MTNKYHQPLTYRFHLPCGQDLLPLLEQPYITVAILRDLLRSRGVFLNTQDKNLLISKMMMTYLTPNEFDYLMGIAIDREEKRKVRNDFEELDTTKNVKLSEALPELSSLNIGASIKQRMRNCSLDGIPSFVRKTENHYKIELKLRRNNLHSSWLKSEQVFDSEINIYKNPDKGIVQIESWHTSEETRIANRILARNVIKTMSEKGMIDRDKSKTIRFDSFSNSQRIAFLMKYTAGFEKEIFQFERLVDLSLRLDPKSKTSDERLKWMKDRVSKLNLNGVALEDTFFVTDVDSREELLVWRFECLYSFDTIDGKGSIRIALEFGGYAKNSTEPRLNAPFQITCTRLSASRYKSSHKRLEKMIITALNDYQLQFFEDIKGVSLDD